MSMEIKYSVSILVFDESENMSKKVTNSLAVLFIVVGIGVMSYPTVSNYINEMNGSYAIQELTDQIDNADSEEIAYQRQLAEEYNKKLTDVEIADVFNSDDDTVTDDEEYDAILDFAHDTMGYIEIPAIDVKLPIYHGTSSTVLAKGVGHMPQTAFPIGGKGNHAVLTGHTGYPEAELFTYLTNLKIGDFFYIYILDEILAYRVDQIKVVLPEETEDLLPVPDKDYCTLITCTPYGINSHRLLVRGERTELEDIPEEQLPEETEQVVSWKLIIIVILLVILLLIAIIVIYRRRKKR